MNICLENNYLLKIASVKKLDPKAVIEALNCMNRLNQLNINGLLKYKIIENSNNALYRISREYKVNLSEIDLLE